MSMPDYNQPLKPLKEMGLFSAISPSDARKYGPNVRAYPLSNRSYLHRYNKLAAKNNMKAPPQSGNKIMPGMLVVRKLETSKQYETWMSEDVFEELHEKFPEPPPYSKQEEIRELSFQYITDAFQFARQAEILLDDGRLKNLSEYHLGYLGKIDVLLYMSIECSLKSLVCIAHINEDPQAMYWRRIRKSSHHFDKLLALIPDFDKIVDAKSLVAKVRALGRPDVSERYCLEISAVSDSLKNFNVGAKELKKEIEKTRTLLATALSLREKIWKYRATALKNFRTLPPHEVKPRLQRILAKLPKPNAATNS